MRIYGLHGLLCAAWLSLAAPVAAETTPEGFITLSSPYTVTATLARLQATVAGKQLQVFDLIDHAAGAQQTGLALRPNAVLIFGSPAMGTALMQCNPRLGLELPIKVHAWEDADGKVQLAYRDPLHLAAQYQLGACGAAVIKKMAGALRAFSHHAIATE